MSLNLDKSTWKRVAFGDVIESVTDRVDNPSEANVDRYVGLEHLDPGHVRQLQIEHECVGGAQCHRFERLSPGGHGDHLVALETQGPIDGSADREIVVHHQDAHEGWSLPRRGRPTG